MSPVFGRRERSLLPANAGELLARYGYHSLLGIDPLGDMGFAALMSLQADPHILNRAADVVVELRTAAASFGCWAVYAASEFVDAFLPSQSESSIAAAMHDERLAVLRRFQIPNLAFHISIKDRRRYDELYPGEFPLLGTPLLPSTLQPEMLPPWNST